MSGHRPFTDLAKDFTPERRARVVAEATAWSESLPREKSHDAQEEGAHTTASGEHRKR
jgi:hypothetical protein